MSDPLAGQREAINRGELQKLRFPGGRPCPVEKGQVFKLRSCEIRIDRVQRRLKADEESEWIVGFVRFEVERDVYLGMATVSEARATQHGDCWGYAEEHGYNKSHDPLDAGAALPRAHQERLSREAAVVNEARRRKLREVQERLEGEAKLARSRHRPNTVQALRAEQERAERRLRAE